MERALVVVEDTEQHRELLDRAGELAEGVDANLLLFTSVTADEAEADFEAIQSMSKQTDYGPSDVLDAARSNVREVGTEVLGGRDLEIDVAATYVDEEDDHATAILEAAEEHDCDHIFITGRRRSPAGKALFGDTAQRVILNFDQPVTVLTG